MGVVEHAIWGGGGLVRPGMLIAECGDFDIFVKNEGSTALIVKKTDHADTLEIKLLLSRISVTCDNC